MHHPRAEFPGMRDRMLHDSLRALVSEAAELLDDRLSAGEEIPFEVGETGAPQRSGSDAGTALFAYRPMTADFVAAHADRLRTLDGFEHAANQLARTRGTVAYLRLRGEPVLDVGELTHARLGVLAFLAAVWSDAEHFAEWEDRFVTAYSELEGTALAERLVTTVFIPVHGVVLDCESVNLGAGVELLAPEDLDGECIDRFSDAAQGADSYCAISVDAPSDAPAPLAAVRKQARDLLTALRMFKPGSVSLGLTAQANVGGAWQQASMPFTGRSREEAWSLLPGEDEELRQFIGAVRRVDRRTRVAWALKRFEMGLERSVPAEGLTDFLAALRTLLEAHDDNGKAALPARVSALCARDSERVHVRATVEAAFALERLAIDGHIGRADRKRLSKQPPLEVIAESERYLRALLHDLVCGYLATDLKKLADDILLADGEPTGDETAAHEPVYLEPVPDPGAAAPEAGDTREFEGVFDDTAEINAVDLRDEPAVASVVDLHGNPVAPQGVAGADDDFGAEFDDGPEQRPVDGFVDDFSAPRVEDDAPSADAALWTLRPASEIRPAPVVGVDAPAAPEPAASIDGRETGDEGPATAGPVPADDDFMIGGHSPDDAVDSVPAPDPRMLKLAEHLVDGYDSALDRSMESEPVSPPASASAPPAPVAPSAPLAPEHVDADDRAAVLFERPPSFERAEDVVPAGDGRENAGTQRNDDETLSPLARAAADAGFTFDFKVIDSPDGANAPTGDRAPVAPRPRQARPSAPLSSDQEFPVPEFELPTDRGPAAAESDAEVGAGAQLHNFKQIMDENFTPPPRDLNERPTTPVAARNGRPHLVAIDGEAAREELPEATAEPAPAAAGEPATRATVEFDVLSDFDDIDESPPEPAWSEAFAVDPPVEPAPEPEAPPATISAARLAPLPNPPQPGAEQPGSPLPAERSVQAPVSSEQERSHRIGPATIEFRPLVDPDNDDPDDFAGAC